MTTREVHRVMTEKIYYESPYIKEFEGKVIECIEDKKGFRIVLDRSAFYPEGGGQPCDKGMLTYPGPDGEDVQVEVYEVHDKNDTVYHYTRQPIAVGTAVKGEIDWDRRFYMMQHHTGDHMFSGIVLKELGYNNIGFHLTDHDLVIDYDGVMNEDDIRMVMDKCNEYIWMDQPVTASYPENVREMEYRSKMSGEVENIRIVRAGDADVCACCGTHVSSTGQVGPIVVTSFSHISDGTRVNIVCGKKAVDVLKKRNDDCLYVSRALSVPVDDIVAAFDKKMREMESLRSRLASLRRELIGIWVSAAEIKDGLAVLIRDGLESRDVQKACIELAEKADVAIVISGGGEATKKIAIVSQKVDTNKLGRHISAIIGGKGGGRPGIYQGFVEKLPDEHELRRIVADYKA